MLGRSIKDYMTSEGLKANVIAGRAGIKENVFSAMVNEKRKITAEEYFAICRALNVPLDRFAERLFPRDGGQKTERGYST